MPNTISREHFPTPDLALRSDDPATLERVRGFADEQARAAGRLASQLALDLLVPTTPMHRTWVLHQAFQDATLWRIDLARHATARLGQGLALDTSRFSIPITDRSANFDRLGDLGRMRIGARWDPATQTYTGGRPTPASRILARYERLARARMDREVGDAEVLVNEVLLPGGRRVSGNRLVRGEAARELGRQLAERVAARGRDASRMEIGGDPLYAVTACEADRYRMFDAALDLLGAAEHGDLDAVRRAEYLLFQSPGMKKGSDATVRVFLVAVSAVLLDQPLRLHQDADLRAMVLGQHAATADSEVTGR